jgi:Fe-S-cluster containining protein
MTGQPSNESNTVDYKKEFYDITNLVQQEFDRNLKLYGEKIQCRRGCSKCCSQIFRITQLDGSIIAQHVKSLAEEERERLVKKAKEYLENLKPPSVPPPDGVRYDVKSDSLSAGEFNRIQLPCPALGDEGECTIYEARPVICRRFGMPIYDYKNPAKVHACELNFSEGEEILDPLLIPNQTEIGKKWDEVKEKFGAEATTIAYSIVKAL